MLKRRLGKRKEAWTTFGAFRSHEQNMGNERHKSKKWERMC